MVVARAHGLAAVSMVIRPVAGVYRAPIASAVAYGVALEDAQLLHPVGRAVHRASRRQRRQATFPIGDTTWTGSTLHETAMANNCPEPP